MIFGFILRLSLGFRVLILSSLRSEVLFDALGSKIQEIPDEGSGWGRYLASRCG